MKKIVNIILISLIGCYVALGQSIKTKTYNVKNYDKILVANSLNINLKQDGKEGVTVTCDDRLLSVISINKRGNQLRIELDWDEADKVSKKSFFRGRSISVNENYVKINGKTFNGSIDITVHGNEISELRAIASADIYVESGIKSSDLELEANSSGSIIVNGNIKSDYLKTVATSSANILMKGDLKTTNLDINANSSGDIKWKGLAKSEKLEISSTSSADVRGNCKTKKAELTINSSGSYKGDLNTDIVKAYITSSADYKGKIDADNAEFQLNSSGGANVSGKINNLYIISTTSADFYGKEIVYKYAEVKTNTSGSIRLSKSGKVVDKTEQHLGVFVN